jgi:DNA-binding MarR family transcriptional regulator
MCPSPPRRTHAGFRLERSVTHRLHTLGKLTDRMTQQAYLAEAGVALGEGRCLAAVGSFAPLSVNDLAGVANLNKGQASRAAQTLVEQGLVRKDMAPGDGRGVVLSLTPAGARVWDRLQSVIERRNREITACLSAEQFKSLDEILDCLVSHASASRGAISPARDEP